MPLTPEVLHLELSEGKALAVAVVRIGVVEIERVRVVERDGKLSVRLPAVQVAGGRLCPAVRLPPDVFKAMNRAVMDEYRRALDADPWADMRRVQGEQAPEGRSASARALNPSNKTLDDLP